jgi:2'-5' RNA ligase
MARYEKKIENMKYLKLFEKFINENMSNDLRKHLTDKYDVKDEYGSYEIKVDNPEKIKKQLLKDYESGIMKIDIEGDKLMIFKNDAKYDCIMFNAKFDKEKWNDVLAQIDKSDLYEDPEGIEEFGLENQPHITVIFGIHSTENDRTKLIEKIKKYKPIKLKVSDIGMFETDKYDVLKLDIKPTKELLKYRDDLISTTKNTQSYPEYHPHMTLAYVKKGTGKKYLKKLKFNFNEFEFDTIIYSDHKYNKKKIKLEE